MIFYYNSTNHISPPYYRPSCQCMTDTLSNNFNYGNLSLTYFATKITIHECVKLETTSTGFTLIYWVIGSNKICYAEVRRLITMWMGYVKLWISLNEMGWRKKWQRVMVIGINILLSLSMMSASMENLFNSKCSLHHIFNRILCVSASDIINIYNINLNY